jgi:hypothetical protein
MQKSLVPEEVQMSPDRLIEGATLNRPWRKQPQGGLKSSFSFIS